MKAPEAVEATVSVLSQYLETRRLVVISFSHDVVHEIVQRISIDGGLSTYHRPLTFDGFIPAATDLGRLRHRVWSYEFLDPRAIELSKSLGYINFVYDPQTSEDHAHCRDIGVDGLITDHARFLLPTPDSRAR